MPFCCNVVSLYSAVTHAILAYGCNETYCSSLELFVYCHITNFITVVQRSVCLCVFFLFFQCNTTVIYAEDTATFDICNWQCFKLLVFFRSLYSEGEHVLKLRQQWLWCGCCSAFCTKGLLICRGVVCKAHCVKCLGKVSMVLIQELK